MDGIKSKCELCVQRKMAEIHNSNTYVSCAKNMVPSTDMDRVTKCSKYERAEPYIFGRLAFDITFTKSGRILASSDWSTGGFTLVEGQVKRLNEEAYDKFYDEKEDI